MEQTADQNAAHQNGNRVNALAGDQGDHDRNKGKARSLDNRQPRANRAKSNGLEQSGDAREEHRHLDHIDHLRKIRAV